MTDQQIRDHIDSMAQPLTLDEILDSTVVTRVVPTSSAHRVRPWAVAAALIAVLGLAGLAVITLRDTDSAAPVGVQPTVTSNPPTESIPSADGSTSIGVEESLVEIPVTDLQEVAKPGSAHAFSVEGHPPVLLWTTLSPNPQTGSVEEWQCVSEAGGSGCGPTSMPAQFGQTSSIDNRVATDDLFTWSNLPPDVETVRYDDGVTRRWQRPIAGLAIFRVDPDHAHPDITAYDKNGAKLAYSFWGQNAPLSPDTTNATGTTEPSNPADIGSMIGELDALAQSATHDCLSGSGATWTVANVPTFADGVDTEQIWNRCVLQVAATVAHRQAELRKGP
jgi:hypothetical protein